LATYTWALGSKSSPRPQSADHVAVLSEQSLLELQESEHQNPSMPAEDLPPYTIKPVGPRFQLRGADLPTGMWFNTGKAAVKYARENLRGCKVEVYAPDDVPFKIFVVPVKPPSSMGFNVTAEDLEPNRNTGRR
jgi:hypothetical protein